MIWLAWRQFRKQALFTGFGLAELAIPTGLAMHHSFNDLALPECIRALGSGRAGAGKQRALQRRAQTVQQRVQTCSADSHPVRLPAAVRGVVLGLRR
jgi:hypothetical protein